MRLFVVIICIILIFGFSGFAQEEDFEKDVLIVKPYEPAISDAFKYSKQPKIEDTVSIPPYFDYSIESKKTEIDFEVEPIRSAKTVGEPLTKLYRGYIRLGYGNYFTPYAEIDYNTLRSKKYLFGITGKHLSSSGKIKLYDDKNVFAGYNDNKIGTYAKGFYNNSTVSGDLNFLSNKIYFYGFDERYLNDINPKLDRNDVDNKTYNILDFNGRYRTNYTDSLHLNYDLKLNYHHLQHNKNKDFDVNAINISGDINKFINNKKVIIGGELKISYYDQGRCSRFNNINDTVKEYTVIKLNPYTGFDGNGWRIRIGLKTFTAYTGNNGPAFHYYPDISAQYNMIGSFLIPYIGFTGKYEVNDYRSIVQENNFINPELAVYRSDYRKHIYGGLRGNFSPEIRYNIKATYSVVDDMYFYVNDIDSLWLAGNGIYLMNDFIVVYDDIECLNFFCGIDYKHSGKLKFLLKGSYSKYTMTNEFRPWHIPDYELVFGAKYNLRNKILVNAEIFGIGKRNVLIYTLAEIEDYELDGIVDINLGLEYRFSKILSVFVNLNNITAQKYYRWNNYPMQGFNFMAGISYSLLGEKSSVN